MGKVKNLDFGTLEKCNVFIEIPKGSPIKYEYDSAGDKIIEEFIFTDGFKFEYNYGFIPRTRGGDGDNLDVMVLADAAIAQGTVVLCRAIGMIELLDRAEVDNKILAVLIADKSKDNIHSVEDLAPSEIESFKTFFAGLAKQKNKSMQIKGFFGKEKALQEIQKSLQSYS
jgi:inorganic pyrophosphatase